MTVHTMAEPSELSQKMAQNQPRPGQLRFDILVMISYQMLQFFCVQQLFPVLLEYLPKTVCSDSQCFSIPSSRCPDVTVDLCQGKNQSTCVASYSDTQYYSAALELKYYCYISTSISPTLAQFAGVLLGNLILGPVADRFGRRLTVLWSLITGIPMLVLPAAIPDAIWPLYVFRFLAGISIGGAMTVGWAYHSELISPQHRFKLRTFSNWANGRLLMVALCYWAGEWRLSSFLCGAVSVLCLGLIAVLPESPMWLHKKGRFADESIARKRIMLIGGTRVAPLTADVEEAKVEEVKKKTMGFFDIFRDSMLRKYLLLLWLMWFSTGGLVYTIDLGGADMTHNLFLGQFLSSFLLSLARVVIGFADAYFPWLGRRSVFIGSMTTFNASLGGLIALHVLDMKATPYYLAMYLTAFVSISLSWESCYLAAAELMPTDVRATATASCDFFTRVANLISTQLVVIRDRNEVLAFSILAAFGCVEQLVVSLYLPNTKNRDIDRAYAEKRENAEGSEK